VNLSANLSVKGVIVDCFEPRRVRLTIKYQALKVKLIGSSEWHNILVNGLNIGASFEISDHTIVGDKTQCYQNFKLRPFDVVTFHCDESIEGSFFTVSPFL
jgi:hypothetical protein